MGNPGKACIDDRNRGGKFDWWRAYYDPIANDVPVQSASIASTAEQLVSAITGTTPGNMDPQLLLGAALIAAVVLFS